MKAGLRVTVQKAYMTGTVPAVRDIREWVRHAIAEARRGEAADAGVTVRIVGEEESRALNLRFRRKDKPTNVLAFPASSDGFPGVPRKAADRALGDIVICAPVVEREAAEQCKTPASHWYHLLVHGTLHLLGYDHQNETDAARMERLETRILAARGIDDPYRLAGERRGS